MKEKYDDGKFNSKSLVSSQSTNNIGVINEVRREHDRELHPHMQKNVTPIVETQSQQTCFFLYKLILHHC